VDCERQENHGWELVDQAQFDPRDWAAASELGPADHEPWKLPSDLIARKFALVTRMTCAAALVRSGSLMVAAGTAQSRAGCRPAVSTATTVQALEDQLLGPRPKPHLPRPPLGAATDEQIQWARMVRSFTRKPWEESERRIEAGGTRVG